MECPIGHEIANVEIVDDVIVPDGFKHGVDWWSPDETRTWLRVMCPVCRFDVSAVGGGLFDHLDYRALCDALKAAEAAGQTEHRIEFPV